MMELEPKQMVAFAVRNVHNLRSEVLCAFGNRCGSSQRSARNFERNLRCWPKSAMNRDQRSACRDIKSRSEL